MSIDFSDLVNDDSPIVNHPRDIFFTLNRSKEFQFPRDIQTEVMEEWFKQREKQDTIIKLNVGSGKTLVGLLLLQSSLNEKIFPAIYLAPDRQLVNQITDEAEALGIKVTKDIKNSNFHSGDSIFVTTIHKLFNGKSVFGVGQGDPEINLGAVVIDDVHACVATIKEQFRILLSYKHPAYQEILKIIEGELERRELGLFLEVKSGDPRPKIEVPYWAWIGAQKEIMSILHRHKNDDKEYGDNDNLFFSYPLLRDILPLCRCIIGGQKLEIEPDCPPTGLIQAFSRAKRRIYMTATLADDSELVTHFGIDQNNLCNPIVPKSSQFMGERMILMPQEINSAITTEEIKKLLVHLAEKKNVVVIVPSKAAAERWENIANQKILMASDIVEGVNNLRNGHVGLTVLVNRYDGIDLPHDACRVLVIDDLPKAASFSDLADMDILGHSQIGLRRQMQRIEQGMGRGIRSNNDYCVVLLVNLKLIRQVRSPEGIDLMNPATKAQLDFSKKIAEKFRGTNIKKIAEIINQCLDRKPSWLESNKKVLFDVQTKTNLVLHKTSIAVRAAFDAACGKNYKEAADLLENAIKESQDKDERAWLMSKLAAIQHHLNQAESQKTLQKANKLNANILRPLEGVPYEDLLKQKSDQVEKIQSYYKDNFYDAVDRTLKINILIDDLHFQEVEPDKFEAAIDKVAQCIGLISQRPEKNYGEGPDNLWKLPNGSFLVIECKNKIKSDKGISKKDTGQLEQARSWFIERYMEPDIVTPVIIHPLKFLVKEASKVERMHIMTEVELSKLRKALKEFTEQLCTSNILSSPKQIKELLALYGFNDNEFLKRYTTTLR